MMVDISRLDTGTFRTYGFSSVPTPYFQFCPFVLCLVSVVQGCKTPKSRLCLLAIVMIDVPIAMITKIKFP